MKVPGHHVLRPEPANRGGRVKVTVSPRAMSRVVASPPPGVRRVRGTAHALLGYAGSDGFPVVVPVDVESVGDDGLGLSAAGTQPPGARRTGLLGHSYRPQLIGLESRAYTGWLEVGEDGRALYAPHTEAGYRAPASKTGLLLLNGLLAKRGVRQARRAGAAKAR